MMKTLGKMFRFTGHRSSKVTLKWKYVNYLLYTACKHYQYSMVGVRGGNWAKNSCGAHRIFEKLVCKTWRREYAPCLTRSATEGVLCGSVCFLFCLYNFITFKRFSKTKTVLRQKKVSGFWSPRVGIFCSLMKRLSNCSQNSWTDWNSAVLRFKR